MEESMISTNYMSKPLDSFSDYSSDQESGWSFLEDFPDHDSDTKNEGESLLSDCETSSMVSDAACYSPPKKHRIDHCDRISPFGVSLSESSETLCSKRRKTDHELEDTASSSPAFSTQEYNFLNTQAEHEGMFFGIHQRKSNSLDQMELIGKERNCTDLRRKGLCLVPVCMFNLLL